MSFYGFTSISKDIHYYDPKEASEVGRGGISYDAHPKTIMIFGWADANPRNLTKYTAEYSQMYPSSRIILVTSSSFSALTSSSKERQKSCLPAARLLFWQSDRSEDNETRNVSQTSQRILVHAFSNGGMVNLIATCEAYQTLTGTNSPFPHNLLILDSTPGGHLLSTELPRLSRVIARGLKSSLPLPEFLIVALSILFVVCVVGIPTMFGFQNSASLGRRGLNDPALLSLDADRVYFYSKADDLIGWQDVEEHAAEAEKCGWRVHLKDFYDSPHCQHMRMHPERYWPNVENSWKTVANSWLGKDKY
jgi:hypothetical protein